MSSIVDIFLPLQKIKNLLVLRKWLSIFNLPFPKYSYWLVTTYSCLLWVDLDRSLNPYFSRGVCSWIVGDDQLLNSAERRDGAAVSDCCRDLAAVSFSLRSFSFVALVVRRLAVSCLNTAMPRIIFDLICHTEKSFWQLDTTLKITLGKKSKIGIGWTISFGMSSLLVSWCCLYKKWLRNHAYYCKSSLILLVNWLIGWINRSGKNFFKINWSVAINYIHITYTQFVSH